MAKLPIIDVDKSLPLDTLLQHILNRALVAIGAKSGSLMLIDHAHQILQIKARLGKPQSMRQTEPVFAVGDSSIAGLVARTGEPYLCNNVKDDKHFAYSRSGKLGFKSLISVPIIAGTKVIGIINADDARVARFSAENMNTLFSIACQVGEPVAERVQRIDVLEGLHQVGVALTQLPTEGGVELVLKRIARAAVESLAVDIVTLYQYDQERDLFLVEGTGPTIEPEGGLKEPGKMRTKVDKGDVPWIVVHEKRSGWYPDVHDVDFLMREIPRKDRRERFIDREYIKSMAALLLFIRSSENDAQEIVGVMFANYRTPHEFTNDERKELAIFAEYAAVAIQNTRLDELRAKEQIAFTASIAASFAHRMKNVAGTIPVAVQLLRENIPAEDRSSQQQLDSIESDTRMLLNLAQRLARPFSEGGGLGQSTSVDVSELVSKVLTRVKAHSPDVQVIYAPGINLPLVTSVEIQLEEVFDNIATNSIEAMEDQTSKQLIVRTRSNETNSRVEVEITDNGPGIPPKVRNKLFTPGSSSKQGKGWGLGLWWCKTFLRATGGDVILMNTSEDQGSTFLVQLPVALEQRSRSLTWEREMIAPHILIVEDLPNWRRQLLYTLSGRGYSAEAVSSADEARQALMSNQFKLAVIDIRLVDADETNIEGLELIEEIDLAELDMKVIAITGHGTVFQEQRAWRSSRLVDFIYKENFNVNHFIAKVVSVISPNS